MKNQSNPNRPEAEAMAASYDEMRQAGVAATAVLYDTSKIIRYWPNDRYVGASLELFASVALMFWYILRLLMSRR